MVEPSSRENRPQRARAYARFLPRARCTLIASCWSIIRSKRNFYPARHRMAPVWSVKACHDRKHFPRDENIIWTVAWTNRDNNGSNDRVVRGWNVARRDATLIIASRLDTVSFDRSISADRRARVHRAYIARKSTGGCARPSFHVFSD